jgi:hypothetical protein
MRVRPLVRFSFGIKKSVDHDGFELARSSSAYTRGFAANDCCSGIDRGADCIRKNDFAAVWNSFRIDGAMSGAQTSPGTGELRALTRPITGHAGKDRFLVRESGRR